MRALNRLNQSGTGWTKYGLTREWGGLTAAWRRYILDHILGDEKIVEGDALPLLFEVEDGAF